MNISTQHFLSPRFPHFQSLEVFGCAFSSHWKRLALSLLALAACGGASAAVVATENFNGGPALWIDRDAGEMIVNQVASPGNPGGSLHGSFSLQGAASFESDAFRAGAASSAGAFSGNLSLSYGNLANVRFAFYAEDVLPSTFIFRIGDGTNTYFNNITPQVTTIATWTTVDVSLAYSGSWLGGNAASFSNVFTGVNFMDVQIARNGTAAQDYYLDNFTLFGVTVDLSAVPEPGSLSLLLAGGFALRIAYKRRHKRTQTFRHENV